MAGAENSPAPLSAAVFHVLLALSAGPLHGYAIMKIVEQDSGVARGPGTIYGALDRLLEAGLVVVVDAAVEDSRRSRAFALTDRGRLTLEREGSRLERLARLVKSRGPVKVASLS